MNDIIQSHQKRDTLITWVTFGMLAAMVGGSSLVQAQLMQRRLLRIEENIDQKLAVNPGQVLATLDERLAVRPADVLERLASLEARWELAERIMDL